VSIAVDDKICRGREANTPPQLICDIAKAEAFSAIGDPHAPVLSAFGGGRLHACRMHGSWDLERAMSENHSVVIRSVHKFVSEYNNYVWDDITFRFGRHSFLYADDHHLVGYADDPREAERLVTEFSDSYAKPIPPTGGQFHLIRQGRNDVGCELVQLDAGTILSTESLALHYGSGSLEWHQGYLEKLNTRNNGLTIFEGTPGTGKTFYLRHLMGVLKETHRFYFIPASTLNVLSNPEFIGFWAQQRNYFSKHKFVVVLEDSDVALMTRGTDNRDQVSAILNLSDGMLADFLRLQIICTINCAAADIDQALLRPGRLLCHRAFGKLDYLSAVRLAESLERKLPVVRDYSLAEVYAEHETDQTRRTQIGFAA
jgi:hypothetical protein